MRTIIIATAALAMLTAGAAFAQGEKPAEGTTLAFVLAKGTTLSAQGMDFDVSYKPDGTFDAGVFAGKYKVEGKKLCLEIVEASITTCSVYPDGKKSGDKFQIETDMGPIDIKIK